MYAYPDAPQHGASAAGQGKLTFVMSEASVEPVVGDVGRVAILSPVIDGEIRLWTDEGHALWKFVSLRNLRLRWGRVLWPGPELRQIVFEKSEC
jgi:hypothetical protein